MQKITKENAIIYIYSEGGHKGEMKLLLNHLDLSSSKYSEFKKISISENNNFIDASHINYSTSPVRNKYSSFQTYKNFLRHIFQIIKILFKIKKKYNVKLILSTGAGISILPILFFKFYKVKSLHFESDCRFTTKSMSGKILHRLVYRFYVPHKSLKKLYKNSHFAGQL